VACFTPALLEAHLTLLQVLVISFEPVFKLAGRGGAPGHGHLPTFTGSACR
jgi:hypothetical protein